MLKFDGLKMAHYRAIHIDVPWNFKVRSENGEGRSASQHYNVMSLADIRALPVIEHAAPDCVCFMWITDPFLMEGGSILQAWGFTYKTVAFSWTKMNRRAEFLDIEGEDGRAVALDDLFMNTGYWTRANGELCLLGTRGKPKRQAADVRRPIISQRREHSRKPDEVFPRIERLVPGPYADIFSRESRPGWDTWGNEKGKFDVV